jgi:hypothetical protein
MMVADMSFLLVKVVTELAMAMMVAGVPMLSGSTQENLPAFSSIFSSIGFAAGDVKALPHATSPAPDRQSGAGETWHGRKNGQAAFGVDCWRGDSP